VSGNSRSGIIRGIMPPALSQDRGVDGAFVKQKSGSACLSGAVQFVVLQGLWLISEGTKR
jgi:hypothetical protein